MKLTRWSLSYLAGYLLLTGIFFLAAPQFSMKLLLASGSYDPLFIRFTGAFMIALGAIVFQIIRFKVEILYTTTLFIRLFFVSVICWFYFLTRDFLFINIFIVVGTGVLLTFSGYIFDHRKSSKNLTENRGAREGQK